MFTIRVNRALPVSDSRGQHIAYAQAQGPVDAHPACGLDQVGDAHPGAIVGLLPAASFGAPEGAPLFRASDW